MEVVVEVHSKYGLFVVVRDHWIAVVIELIAVGGDCYDFIAEVECCSTSSNIIHPVSGSPEFQQ